MSQRPSRQTIDKAVKRVAERAERDGLPSNWYAWHRRFILGIDRRLETAELRTRKPIGPSYVEKAVELAVAWLSAEKEQPESLEEAACLFKIEELLNELQDV